MERTEQTHIGGGGHDGETYYARNRERLLEHSRMRRRVATEEHKEKDRQRAFLTSARQQIARALARPEDFDYVAAARRIQTVERRKTMTPEQIMDDRVDVARRRGRAEGELSRADAIWIVISHDADLIKLVEEADKKKEPTEEELIEARVKAQEEADRAEWRALGHSCGPGWMKKFRKWKDAQNDPVKMKQWADELLMDDRARIEKGKKKDREYRERRLAREVAKRVEMERAAKT